MNSVSLKKLPTIIILRGGKEDNLVSIKEGANVLVLLRNYGYNPIDIYIDENDILYNKGIQIEKHAIFSEADAYIDLTRSKISNYKDLADRMGLFSLLGIDDTFLKKDRETIYRILRQKDILVPDTKIIRAKSNIVSSDLQEIWRKMHTPYFIRSLWKKSKSPSILVTSFDKLNESLNQKKDEDIMIMTYRNSMPISIAILPDYRGEELYTPIPVQTLVSAYQTPNDIHTKKLLTHISNEEKKQISDLAKKVYKALDIKGYALVDIIKTQKGYMVVEVQTEPSLLPDSRFLESLKSTGVDIGHFIHSRLEKLE